MPSAVRSASESPALDDGHETVLTDRIHAEAGVRNRLPAQGDVDLAQPVLCRGAGKCQLAETQLSVGMRRDKGLDQVRGPIIGGSPTNPISITPSSERRSDLTAVSAAVAADTTNRAFSRNTSPAAVSATPRA